MDLSTHVRRLQQPMSQDFFSIGKISQLWSPHENPIQSLSKRAPATTDASTTSPTCVNSKDSNTCEKSPTSGMTSVLPIALGVSIPVIAIIVFIFLHRRYRKQLRAEDRHDAEKYKSMDFGMDLDNNFGEKGGKKGKKEKNAGPEMQKAYHPRQMKGLSIDPSHSPFFLNNDKGAKDSDSIFEDEDRYKLVKVMDPSRSNSRAGTPSSQHLHRVGTESSLTSSRFDSNSRFNSTNQFGSDAQLMSNAQSPSMSAPPRGESLRSRDQSSSPPPAMFQHNQSIEDSMQYNNYDKPFPPAEPKPVKLKDDGLMVPNGNDTRDSYFDKNAANIRNSNNYLNQFFTEKAEKYPTDRHGTDTTIDSAATTVVDTRNNSLKTADSYMHESGPPPVLPPLPINYNDAPAESYGNDSLHSGTLPTQSSVAKQTPEYDDEEDLEYPPRHKSFEASMHYHPSFVSDSSNLTDILRTPRDSSATLPPVPALPSSFPPRGPSLAASPPVINEPKPDYLGISNGYSNGGATDDNNRLSVLMRPLPPDDAQENPEERANRIRSFYKEYFDDNHKPIPPNGAVPLPPQQSQQAYDDYYEDYTSEYLNGGTVYDAHQNGFVVASAPFAEPITRRAMTPPPRAPPRFQPHGPPPRAGRMRASSNAHSNGPHGFPPRGASAMSQQYPPPPRGMSAMSHRNRHQQFKKPMPPPKTLNSLPTPHMLKDDAAIFGAADFAPPISFRELQNGRRPDSPLGVQRPYSPAVKAFVPLNSSFDDLAHVPSPHLLRKSGTFNNLDFAPPPRFKNTDAGSDASSIRSGRSGRSGISAGQQHAMRAGAYRMSRVPKELLGTKTDIMASLRPQMDLTRPS